METDLPAAVSRLAQDLEQSLRTPQKGENLEQSLDIRTATMGDRMVTAIEVG